MSISHIIILAIIVLLVIPPDKLPELMRNIGRFINDIRRQTNGVMSSLNEDIDTLKKNIETDDRSEKNE